MGIRSRMTLRLCWGVALLSFLLHGAMAQVSNPGPPTVPNGDTSPFIGVGVVGIPPEVRFGERLARVSAREAGIDTEGGTLVRTSCVVKRCMVHVYEDGLFSRLENEE